MLLSENLKFVCDFLILSLFGPYWIKKCSYIDRHYYISCPLTSDWYLCSEVTNNGLDVIWSVFVIGCYMECICNSG